MKFQRFMPACMAIAAAVVGSAPATAGQVTLDFNQNLGVLPNSASFGSIKASAKAWTTLGGTWGSLVTLGNFAGALGVLDNTVNNLALTGYREGVLFDLDNSGYASIILSFTGDYNPISIWKGDGPFSASSQASPLTQALITNGSPASPLTLSNFNARYLFVAAGNRSSGPAAFQIDSLTAVPEPTSVALVGLALLALNAARRSARAR